MPNLFHLYSYKTYGYYSNSLKCALLPKKKKLKNKTKVLNK